MAFVYEDASFSNSVVDPAKVYAQQIGMNVVFSERYAPNTTDFSALIDKVIASKATVLMGGGHYADGSTLAKQLYEHKVPLKMITLLVAPDSDKWPELGDAAVGVSVPSQWEPQVTLKAQYGPSGADFAKWYKAKYNAEPSYESAGGYAAGLILQRAIEQAGGTDTAKVADALNKTDITTFYGRTKFSTAANDHGLQVGHCHGPGAVAKGQIRQAGKAGGLAAGSQERKPGISDSLTGLAGNRMKKSAHPARRERNVRRFSLHD